MDLSYFSNLGVKYPKWFLNMPVDYEKKYTMRDLVALSGKTRATLCVWVNYAEKESILSLVKGKNGVKKIYKFNENNFKLACKETRERCVFSNKGKKAAKEEKHAEQNNHKSPTK